MWRRRGPIGAVAAVLALNVGIWTWTRAREQAREAPLPLLPVQSPAAAPAATSEGEGGFLGVLLAGETAVIEPKAEGRVMQVLVKPGDQVLRGTPLASIDQGGREQELDSARAALAEATRRFSRRAALANAVPGALAPEELDTIRLQMAQEKARVAVLERSVADAQLLAPFDGTVVEQYLTTGALAGPGRPVVRLITTGQPRVRFAVPEEKAHEVVAGAPIEVKIATLGLEAKGIVATVNPELDVSSRMVFAAGDLRLGPQWQDRLTTGLAARVRVLPSARVLERVQEQVNEPPTAPAPEPAPAPEALSVSGPVPRPQPVPVDKSHRLAPTIERW
jgi:RND family efflux transporter MFP subunit